MRRSKNGEEELSGVEEEDCEGDRRVIIIRGPNGEVVVDSGYESDTLENMARLARDQYSQGAGKNIPGYCT